MKSILSAASGLLKISGGVAIAANALGTLVVLALVGVVSFDIVARGVFNAPFLGAVEVVQFSIVLIVFLQLPDVVRVDRLTCSDGFLILVSKRWPKIGLLMRRMIYCLSAAFMLLVAIAIFPEFIEMWHTKDYFGVPGVFTAPWWPIKLVILFGAALSALIFALKILLPPQKSRPVLLPESDEASQ